MVYAANKAIYLIILLSAAPIAIATFIGLLIGLLQTITQIQEQTLPFAVSSLWGFLFVYL